MTEDLPDDVALQRATQGDAEAISILYERYVNRIFNYIFYRTGSVFDAEDLTARVFYRALKHLGTYRNMGVPFSAWLYRIAHNLVANWHRDNSRRKELPLEEVEIPLGSGDHPETSLVAGQEVERLLKAIRKLQADRQQLVILKYVEGLSNAEIGVIMGRSEGAIKSLYHRTLVELRSTLEKMEQT